MEIVISRPRQYIDRVRAYDLQVDGLSVAKIRAGEEIRLQVPDGAQNLVAKVDWCASVVLRSSWDIKTRIFRQLIVENPRNSLLLLWFSPRFDEKFIVFISPNLRATLH